MDKESDLPPPLEDLTEQVEQRFGKDFGKVLMLLGRGRQASKARCPKRTRQKAREAKTKHR
jgi:hypothetical protein